MDPPGLRDALAPDYLDDRDWVRSVQSANADPARLFPCEFPSRDTAQAKQPRGRARSECPWRDSFEWRTARQQSQEPPPFLYATAVPDAGPALRPEPGAAVTDGLRCCARKILRVVRAARARVLRHLGVRAQWPRTLRCAASNP